MTFFLETKLNHLQISISTSIRNFLRALRISKPKQNRWQPKPIRVAFDNSAGPLKEPGPGYSVPPCPPFQRPCFKQETTNDLIANRPFSTWINVKIGELRGSTPNLYSAIPNILPTPHKFFKWTKWPLWKIWPQKQMFTFISDWRQKNVLIQKVDFQKQVFTFITVYEQENTFKALTSKIKSLHPCLEFLSL